MTKNLKKVSNADAQNQKYLKEVEEKLEESNIEL